jgi:hypothetical protein
MSEQTELDRLRAALKQIVEMDLTLKPNGGRDFYSGAGRFFSAWLIAYAALSSISSQRVQR